MSQLDEKKFRIEKEPDPSALTAIRAREEVCDDPELSDGAVRLFVRLLDMALNPFLNNGRRGQIIVSQMKLGCLLHCDERSIRRRTDELVRRAYVWTTLIPRPNTKPILCYHVTAFQPKKQVEQEMSGDGLWGNGKRRYDSGFARTGKEATGHQRRMGSLIVDRFGKPVFSYLFENTPTTGQETPLSPVKIVRSERTVASYATGQNCPVSADASVRSQRSKLSAVTGQNCPVSADASVRLKESPVGDSGGLGVERGTPSPDLQFAEFRKSLKGEFRSRLVKTKSELQAKLWKAQSPEARAEWKRRLAAVEEELLGGPVPDQVPSSKPKPTRAAAPEKPMSEADLLESARTALSLGVKLASLTNAQREALARSERA